MDTNSQNLQIFIESPICQTQALILSPTQSLTLQTLKLKFLKTSQNLQSFYFTLNGKPLPDKTQIPSSLITRYSTLYLQPRFSGGGGDGGATGAESRDCYLNMYAEKKPDKVDPNEKRLSKWLNCALSNEPLKQPCVIDCLGNLFNKEALVEALINKRLPKGFSYIKGLKDMINIKLELVPGAEKNSDCMFHCPITGLEFNGKYKFFALRSCGHVLSAKALKEVKSSSCLVCYKEFEECDKIVINGSDEEVAALRERMEEGRVKVAVNGKEKKSKKVKDGSVEVVRGSVEVERCSGKKHGIGEVHGVEKAVAKVEENANVQNGTKESNGGAVKKFKATDILPPNANKEVYASIFTSSKKSNFKETYSCRSLPLGRN